MCEEPSSSDLLEQDHAAWWLDVDPRAPGSDRGSGVVVDPRAGLSWVASTRDRTNVAPAPAPSVEVATTPRRATVLLEILAEAGALLLGSLDPALTLAALARHVVARLGGWCGVYVRRDDGVVETVALEHVEPRLGVVLRELDARFPPGAEAEVGYPRALRTGRSELRRDVAESGARSSLGGEPDHVALRRRLGTTSEVTAPAMVAGRAVAAVCLGSGPDDPRHDDASLRLAEDLALRVGLALENVRVYRAACQAVESRDKHLAAVAHDLKNPLGNIQLCAAMLLSGLTTTSPPALQVYARLIDRAVARMTRLTSDLLDVGAIAAGAPTLAPHRVAVATLVAEACDNFRAQPAQRPVDLRVECPVDADVWCDRDRVLAVFADLLNHALETLPATGVITVRAGLGPTAVRFAIEDTGPGIPPDDVPYVFDRCRPGRRGPPSAGPGLSMARGIIQGHGGRIWASSQVGVGSVFAFTLPVCPASAAS